MALHCKHSRALTCSKMKSIFILLLSIRFLFTHFTKASSAMDQDLENPLLSESSQSRSRDVTVSNSALPDADGSWKVPRAQFDVGVPIYGTIFGFMTAWGEDDPINVFVRAIYVMSFLVCAQVYFGFNLALQRRPGAMCPNIPRIVYHKIDFPSGPLDVSFGRWASGPFSWVTAAISFLPPDAYLYLEESAYFPKRSIIHLLFMVQLLYYFGMYDCYRQNVMQS